MFRHKGERKVKTIEEDMEQISSSTAELLEEGEELIGDKTHTKDADNPLVYNPFQQFRK